MTKTVYLLSASGVALGCDNLQDVDPRCNEQFVLGVMMPLVSVHSSLGLNGWKRTPLHSLSYATRADVRKWSEVLQPFLSGPASVMQDKSS